MLQQILQQFVQIYTILKSQVVNMNEQVSALEARLSGLEQMLSQIQANQSNIEPHGDLQSILNQVQEM